VVDGDAVLAHNTDVSGLSDAWGDRGLPTAAPVLILGSGGAAAAALLALAGRVLVVAARRLRAAEALIERVAVSASTAEWGHPVAGAVVVNATPLGMHGEELPAGLVGAASGLFDLAYGERPTPAATSAREVGIPVADGIDHLVAQAARSFTIWTGLAAPVEAMMNAARAA
jgi:shikimate dehydrogenase